MRGAGALTLILGLCMAPAIHAQVRFLTPGDEVRLYVRGVIPPFEGSLIAADADGLQLSTVEGALMTIPRDQVERSEVLGSRANTRYGLALGGAVGLAAGAGLLVASKGDCRRDETGFCEAGATFNEWLLVVPAIVGAGVGALVGSALTTSRWIPAFLPRGSLELSWSLPVSG